MVLVDINECSSTDCMNGATCIDDVNAYTCACVAGYTGPHCEKGESAYYKTLADLPVHCYTWTICSILPTTRRSLDCVQPPLLQCFTPCSPVLNYCMYLLTITHTTWHQMTLQPILLKLFEPFFDTTVGPRPNLARMCG